MNILLIKSKSLVTKNAAATPPIGLLYLASYLRKHHNVNVRIVDLHLTNTPIEDIEAILDVFNPDLVGISSLTAEDFMSLKIAKTIRSKNNNIPLVLGGPHASALSDEIVSSPDIDIAIIGEGEQTTLEIVQLIDSHRSNWKTKDNLSKINGIVFKDNNETVRTTPREYIEDLDSIPFPAWDLIDYRKYWKMRSMATIGIRPYMAIFTTRGCPYHCVFCHQNFGKKLRKRSPKNIVDEIETLHLMGMDHIEIIDDISNFDKDHFKSVLKTLLERNLHPVISFPNGIRIDRMDFEAIDLLKQVGVGEVSVAIETASQRLQQLIKKNLDLKLARQNIEYMAQKRIFLRGFFMMGFPTETKEELLSTINFACSLPLHLCLFFIVNPFNNTKLHEMFKAQNKLPKKVNSIDYEYYGAPFNGSTLSDKEFRSLYKKAYFKFYLNPIRIFRLIRDRSFWSDIPVRAFLLVKNLLSFRRLKEL